VRLRDCWWCIDSIVIRGNALPFAMYFMCVMRLFRCQTESSSIDTTETGIPLAITVVELMRTRVICGTCPPKVCTHANMAHTQGRGHSVGTLCEVHVRRGLC
jgi:hypothetical protein